METLHYLSPGECWNVNRYFQYMSSVHPDTCAEPCLTPPGECSLEQFISSTDRNNSLQPEDRAEVRKFCRKRQRQNTKACNGGSGRNAERERSRVQTLRGAFLDLQRRLPGVPPDTKLSKLDVLVLATTYIQHLMTQLRSEEQRTDPFITPTAARLTRGFMHPVKKWPMRSRLYPGVSKRAHGMLGQHVQQAPSGIRKSNNEHRRSLLF